MLRACILCQMPLLLCGPFAGALEQPAAAAGPSAAPVQSQSLTLAQALELASRNNMTGAIAEARIQGVLALLQQAYSLLRPSLSVNGGYSLVSSSDRPFGSSPSQTFSGAVSVNMTVFNAAAIPAVAAARRNVQAQRFSSSELRRALAYTVASSFLQIIAGEEQLSAAQRRSSVAGKSLSDTRARTGAGLASENDATRARLEVATADLSLTSAQEAVSTSRLALAQLIGMPVEGRLETPASAVVPGRSLGALESLAVDRRGDLSALLLQVEAQRKLALQARLGGVPTLSLVGSYSDRAVSGVTDFSAGVLPAGDPVWSVGVNAQWQLFDGGLRAGQSAGYAAQAKELYAQYLDQRSLLHRDLATALVALAAAESSFEQSGVQVEVARTNQREVLARSGQGLATALDLADAIASLYEAEAGQTQRRYDLEIARLQVRELVGAWPLSDAAPPNPAGAQR